jgi:hypothetical protein
MDRHINTRGMLVTALLSCAAMLPAVAQEKVPKAPPNVVDTKPDTKEPEKQPDEAKTPPMPVMPRNPLDAKYEDQVRPILASLCFGCHGEKKKKADLDLQRLATGEQAVPLVEMWDKVMERVQAHEMPPEGSRQLNDNQRDTLRDWIGRLPRKPVSDCSKLATDKTQNFYKGYVMSRRLNRAEYNNSVRDLLGLDLRPGDLFPADGAGGEGFNNNGDALFTSPILMEKYLEAADVVLNVVLHDGKPDVAKTGALIGGALGISQEQVEVARQRILFLKPSDKLKPRDAAMAIVMRIARRAYRRPVDATEVERLLTMFDRAHERGDSFESSIRLALKAVLISPHFLFLAEPEPEKEGIYRLGQFPLAARLSYFLWASLPDEELLGLAESGKLYDKDVMTRQVRRMLKDPKSKALGESFAMQWLGLEPLGTTVKPDARKFPQYDAALEVAMRDEAILLFHDVISNNNSLVTLLDADYTFVNERLSSHYGIPNVTGPAMRRVTLTDRNRGGVLGLAAVHTVTSYPLRTSPVLRGKWVLEEILGSKVPPPPANVPSLPPDDDKHEGLSFRQQLEQHRKNPECASCHSRMDPLGFGLENFDAVGRWRTELAGQKIDSTGVLPSGEKFSNPAELKAVLLKKKDEVVRNLSRKMLGYALGRSLNQFDQCVIDDAMKAMRADGYKSETLILSIVLSYPFQYRFAKK